MVMHHELDVPESRAASRCTGPEAGRGGFETHIKKDRSPVTSADLAVNQILQDMLMTAFPHDAWLSEETPDDPRRLKNNRVWIIDPIDGTKYFMRGIPQYAISVALVESHQPVVAAVYNPATDELFSAVRGSGAWLNGDPIRSRPGRPSSRGSWSIRPPWSEASFGQSKGPLNVARWDRSHIPWLSWPPAEPMRRSISMG